MHGVGSKFVQNCVTSFMDDPKEDLDFPLTIVDIVLGLIVKAEKLDNF